MKLSDVVSSMHLTIYAEVPLLIFMGVFVGVCAYMLSQKGRFDEAAQLPLRGELPARRRQ
jgi:cbb3-type cytochrome oxidase subunit 3